MDPGFFCPSSAGNPVNWHLNDFIDQSTDRSLFGLPLMFCRLKPRCPGLDLDSEQDCLAGSGDCLSVMNELASLRKCKQKRNIFQISSLLFAKCIVIRCARVSIALPNFFST